jgi:hypothetical protein
MTLTVLLQELRQRRVTLQPEGDTLRCRYPKGTMTDDMRAAIRQHKGELLALLLQASPQAPVREDAEERAAMYEFDGGMTRRAAERLAAHGHVVGLPACAQCNGMAYAYEDGFVRCTTPWCAEYRNDGGADALDG